VPRVVNFPPTNTPFAGRCPGPTHSALNASRRASRFGDVAIADLDRIAPPPHNRAGCQRLARITSGAPRCIEGTCMRQPLRPGGSAARAVVRAESSQLSGRRGRHAAAFETLLARPSQLVLRPTTGA